MTWLIGTLVTLLATTAIGVWGLRLLKKRRYQCMPNSLKNESAQFNFSSKIMKFIDKKHKHLIVTAKSKFLKDRGPVRILDNPEIRDYIDKYAHVYFDDFSDEISDGVLDWNNENTKLFFELINHKYKVSNRALLRTILYLRHEIEYFNFRDSIALAKPTSLNALFEQTVKYLVTNERALVLESYVERAICEFNLPLPFRSIQSHMEKTKKALELNQFDKHFKRSNTRIDDTAFNRLAKLSWEDMVRLASSEDFDLSPEAYIIAGQDYSRDSRLDRFFKNHMKYALIQHFNGCCVSCSAVDDLELDHFWHPKSKGGNFAMRSQKRLYVNNCIPLCRSCNASKGAKEAFVFFDGEQLKQLLEQSQKFNGFLNSHLQGFADEELLAFNGSADAA